MSVLLEFNHDSLSSIRSLSYITLEDRNYCLGDQFGLDVMKTNLSYVYPKNLLIEEVRK